MGTGAEVLMATQVAGATMSAYGAYQSSKDSAAAYGYQSQVARNNAQIAETQAQDALARGQIAEGEHGKKVAQLKGNQRAILAAHGLDLGEGSALNILSDTDFMGARDLLIIRDNAAREAWGHRVEGANYRADAGLLQARSDAENPLLAGATTLLTGGGSVASSWDRYSRSKGA